MKKLILVSTLLLINSQDAFAASCSFCKKFIRGAVAVQTLGASELAMNQAKQDAEKKAQAEVQRQAAAAAEAERQVKIAYAKDIILRITTELNNFKFYNSTLDQTIQAVVVLKSTVGKELESRNTYTGKLIEYYNSWTVEAESQQKFMTLMAGMKSISQLKQGDIANEKTLAELQSYLNLLTNEVNTYATESIKVASKEQLTFNLSQVEQIIQAVTMAKKPILTFIIAKEIEKQANEQLLTEL